MRGCIVTQTTALMLMPQSPIDADDNLVIIAPVWPNIAAGVTIMGDKPRLVSVDPVPGGVWQRGDRATAAASRLALTAIREGSLVKPGVWP